MYNARVWPVWCAQPSYNGSRVSRWGRQFSCCVVGGTFDAAQLQSKWHNTTAAKGMVNNLCWVHMFVNRVLMESVPPQFSVGYQLMCFRLALLGLPVLTGCTLYSLHLPSGLLWLWFPLPPGLLQQIWPCQSFVLGCRTRLQAPARQALLSVMNKCVSGWSQSCTTRK